MKLATFDIFDTTLIRRCGLPEMVQELLARRLYPADTAAREAFLHWRRHKARGATLAEIYAPGVERDFPEYTRRQLMEAEMAEERAQLAANPAVRTRIQEMRGRGYTIMFLSDMYLESAFLADVLAEQGCLEEGEEVIVSCEHDARKDTGALYRLVRSRYAPAEWHHYGDNRHSDVRMARRAGVKAHHVDTGWTAVERRVLDRAREQPDACGLPLLAGLSRYARIVTGDTPGARLAADYVAPAYLPFVQYVLNEARRRGLDTLHFLSRDGYILMEIASHLRHEPLRLNYLFVSRKALIPAYMHGGDSRERLMAIVDRNTLMRKDVDGLLALLGLDRAQLAADYGIRFGYRQITTEAQASDFLSQLFDNERFMHSWRSHCAEARRLAGRYLSQQGLDGEGASGYVDVGWLGTSRLMLSHLTGRSQAPTFYMGIRGDVLPRRHGDYIPYYRAGSLSTVATAIIESYFSASPYPSTRGYREDAQGRVEPTFKDGEQYRTTRAVDDNRACAILMAEGLKALPPIGEATLKAWSDIAVRSLVEMADRVDLTPMTEATGPDDERPLVRRLSLRELIQLIALGKCVTGFDRGCLAYTLGHTAARRLWPAARLTGRLRGLLFRRLVARRAPRHNTPM